MSEKEQTDFRMREKGYALIAVILHVIPFLLPAMALSVRYTAAPYMLAFVPLIWLTVLIYKSPDDPEQRAGEIWEKQDRLTNRLILAARILAIVIPALLIYANFRLDMGISVWLIIQIACLLLEGLSLQFLYRHRKT